MNLIRLLTSLLLLCGLVTLGHGQSYTELSAQAKKDPEVAYKLGMLCLQRQGAAENVKDPDKKAIEMLELAAGKGHLEAQMALGFCYATGLAAPGGKVNMVKAVNYYKKAAAQDNREAQFKLGMCHEKGLGGLKADGAAAVAMYTKAAELGLAEAQYALGSHIDSLGGDGDYKEKFKWYLAAAKQGMPAAQIGAARCLRLGQGVEKKDLVEALKWAILAAASGDQIYAENLRLMRESYVKDPKLIAEAERRAADFHPE